MRVFLTGATGFVGTHLRRAFHEAGIEVIGLTRRPTADLSDQWVQGDITDTALLADGMVGSDVVINIVGIIAEAESQSFTQVHLAGTEAVLAAMRQTGVSRLLHMSALGASQKGGTEYFRTKWQAEELVRASGIAYTIFRPSLIFGPGDGFLNTLAAQIRLWPIIPIIGTGDYCFAPISVHAVCAAFMQALQLNGPTQARTFELCGPEVLTYRQLIGLLRRQLRMNKPRWYFPVPLVQRSIGLLRFFHLPPPITPDQLAMLLQGSVCADASASASEVFALPLITVEEGIKEYL
jgi:uncharacterized protein YbjT (DUF2867 family)